LEDKRKLTVYYNLKPVVIHRSLFIKSQLDFYQEFRNRIFLSHDSNDSTISANSVPDKGSMFTLRFQLCPFTNIGWWVFALAGIVALLIAFVTVSWQSYKSASKNPVEALRYE